MSEGVTCPACGTGNAAGQKFCSQCGENLSAVGPPAEVGSDQNGGSSGRRRGVGRAWTAVIILVLAVAGAGIGYFAGSLGEESPEPGQGTERSTSTSPTAEDPVAEADLPEVLCADEVGPVTLVAKTEPEECTFLRNGAPANPPGTDFTSAVDLVWTEWSEDRARADGAFIAMGVNVAEFELSEPRNVCGRIVFTKIQIARPGYAELPAGRIEDCP